MLNRSPCTKVQIDHSPLSEGLQFHSYNKDEAGRSSVEQGILNAYQHKFSATLAHFMPTLVSAQLPGQAAHLFFGLSSAAEHHLFLENYLATQIEQVLSKATNTPIDRKSIVEIGNLTFSNTASIHHDLTSIAFYCHQLGYRYVVCTATRILRIVFIKAGIKPLFLGDANPGDVPDDTQWGEYFDTKPQIIAGNIITEIDHLLKAQSLKTRRSIKTQPV